MGGLGYYSGQYLNIIIINSRIYSLTQTVKQNSIFTDQIILRNINPFLLIWFPKMIEFFLGHPTWKLCYVTLLQHLRDSSGEYRPVTCLGSEGDR